MRNSMAELSKEMKIVLIINAIVAFIYGFFYLIIPDIYRNLVDAPYYDPGMWRSFGATAFALGIFSLIIIKRAEWEKGKMFFEFAVLWLIAVLILNIYSFITYPGSATSKANNAFSIVLLIVLVIYNAYFYYRESK